MKFFPITTKAGSRRWQSAFTMMEIAISLAVIGIALVAIIGILPIGLRAQRENREKTLINQDATVFMEMVRNGVRVNSSDTDLTNYVFAITNYQTFFPNAGAPSAYTNGFDTAVLTNNYRIVGLMSTPQFTDANGLPIPALLTNLPNGCYSNHIVAYVHSISGLAVEKPPQGNSLLRNSSFGYRILCDNLPAALPLQEWDLKTIYTNDNSGGDGVFYIDNGIVTYWRALHNTNVNQTLIPPDYPAFWAHDGYTQTMANSAHELRLTFLWPLLPNNNLPPGYARQTYRTLVAGQLALDANTMSGTNLYFFQPQIFTNAP